MIFNRFQKQLAGSILLGTFICARVGLFGKNKLDLNNDWEVKFLSINKTNLLFVTRVSYWVDIGRHGYPPPCWQENKFFIRPIEIYHNGNKY